MWYNRFTSGLLRSPLHGLISGSVMLVEYTGRKSGKRYRVPVNYVQDGKRLLTISFHQRTWWRTLPGANVHLHLRGRDIAARAGVIADKPGVAEALLTLVRRQPAYGRFLDIHPDETGQPRPAEAQRAAETRVVVWFDLQDEA